MIIRKLTIHNLASIEDAVIDFEAEPLRSSEVFLITGKTINYFVLATKKEPAINQEQVV